MIVRLLLAVTLSSMSISAASGTPPLLDAARAFRPDVRWQIETAVSADFDCDGRKDIAILGTSQFETVVAVFLRGTAQKRDSISLPSSRVNPSLVQLDAEGLDVTDSEFKEMLGAHPEATSIPEDARDFPC